MNNSRRTRNRLRLPHDDTDDAESVVMTLKDMIACATLKPENTFKNPCPATNDESCDEDDPLDSFYSEDSEISGLKPFSLPTMSSISKMNHTEPSSDTLFADIDTPINLVVNVSRQDKREDVPETRETVDSKTMEEREPSALEQNLPSPTQGEDVLSPLNSRFEAGGQDKYFPESFFKRGISRDNSSTGGDKEMNSVWWPGLGKSIMKTLSTISKGRDVKEKLPESQPSNQTKSEHVGQITSILSISTGSYYDDDEVLTRNTDGDIRSTQDETSCGSESGLLTAVEAQVIEKLSLHSPEQKTKATLRPDKYRSVNSIGVLSCENVFSDTDSDVGLPLKTQQPTISFLETNLSNEDLLDGKEDSLGEDNVVHLEQKQHTLSFLQSTLSDEEMVVVVEVERADTRNSQEIGALQSVKTVDADGTREIESQSFHLGGVSNGNQCDEAQMRASKDHADEIIRRSTKQSPFEGKRNVILCGILFATLILISAIIFGVVASQLNKSVPMYVGTTWENSSMPAMHPTLSPTNSPTFTAIVISKNPSPSSTKVISLAPSVIQDDVTSSLPSSVTNPKPSYSPTSSPIPVTLTPTATSEIATLAVAMGLYIPSSTSHPLYRAMEWALGQDYQPSRQRIALATFYFGTDGENWLDQLSFLSDEDECNWFVPYDETFKGIACSDDGDVVVLSLFRNGLSGKIPDEVRILSHISMLWLNENTIGGSLPTQLGRLTDLAFFDISDNTIDGTIPSEIGNMQNLQELNVRKNTLSGAVPAEVSSLSSLSNFWADGNFLTGDLTEICDKLPTIILSADCDETTCPCCVICCDERDVCSGASRNLHL